MVAQLVIIYLGGPHTLACSLGGLALSLFFTQKGHLRLERICPLINQCQLYIISFDDAMRNKRQVDKELHYELLRQFTDLFVCDTGRFKNC